MKRGRLARNSDVRMAVTQQDKRSQLRQDVLECGMLWRSSGLVPERVGPAMVTNASLGGLQLRLRHKLDRAERLLLQLGSHDGPIFIPGTVAYTAPLDEEGDLQTAGFVFAARTVSEREALAAYMLSLRDRVSTV